jgi:HD-GYP domain-containing protein (c-di-GMP phosphodiesterase class II)
MGMNLLYRHLRNVARLLSGALKRLRSSNSMPDRRRAANPSGENKFNRDPQALDFAKRTLQEAIAELQRAAEHSRRAFIETLRELATASDSRDPYTRGHSERVTRFSVEIAKIMGFPPDEIERIRIGALIHDIGKLTISEEILNKPAALTEAEYEVMKTHIIRGYDLLKHIPQLKDIIPGMQFHHEQLDGKGYPHGLKGDEIPMIARIITVADCFDAMTTIRPYQDPAPIEHVLEKIRSAAGVKYDHRIVEALIQGVRTGRIMTRVEDRLQDRSED